MSVPDPQLDELADRMRERLARIEELRSAFEARDDRSSAAEDERERELAESARRGELGPERRRLQSRLDLGQTSLEAVLSGEDESREAEAFRTAARAGLTAVHRRMSDDAEEQAEPDPFGELAALQERMAERSAELRRRLEGEAR